VNREDSGIIDLMALQARPSVQPQLVDAFRPSDPPSAPSAFTIDTTEASDLGDLDDFAKDVAARGRRRNIMIAVGGAVAALGIALAAFSGGEPQKPRTALATKVESAPPPPATIAPPPSVSTVLANATPIPPPPTTGAPVSAKPPSARSARGAAKPVGKAGRGGGGPKLQKVQSSGL
jgi:hypothetical protein